jgi:hypothetical protein
MYCLQKPDLKYGFEIDKIFLRILYCIKNIFITLLACLLPITPSISHAQNSTGYNIVDAGLFDNPLIVHVVYYELAIGNYKPVIVENIDIPGVRIEWNDGNGHEGWRSATDFYSGVSVKERKDNTAAAAVGIAAAAILACILGGCDHQSSPQAQTPQ